MYSKVGQHFTEFKEIVKTYGNYVTGVDKADVLMSWKPV